MTYKIEVKGIVQGVGFRPFVYSQALKYNLRGFVNNDDKGVNILIQGEENSCQRFIQDLKNEQPVLAKIDEINIQCLKLDKIYKSFEIIQSENTNNKSTIISPDMSVCDECLSDINDKTNFRYNYALTNCTNCGPRYSIIKTVPYDRVNTSMGKFELCSLCKEEYANPLDRRYHAQPVACEKCGPQVKLYNNNNEVLSSGIEAIKNIANIIKNGDIVAIKGMGGFHIVCDATNEKSVKDLRLKKSRPSKPFAVMFNSLNSIKTYTNPNAKEEELLVSKEKPIVIVNKKENSNICEAIAPNINHLGCFIAYTPLHHLLFRFVDFPIVATSANLKGEPIIRSKDEIIKKLSNVVDYVLDFNRDIINACDDSIVQLVEDKICKLRNARGFAPSHIKLPKKLDKKVLALGANQKSTIAIAYDDNLILSPYIGNLGSLESNEYFTRTINTFKEFYDFVPDVVVCDKHKGYESVKYAYILKQQNPKLELVEVQHHFAHVLSCMAEYSLCEEVIAFAFDGTGLGDDGNIWGGEVFLCTKNEYKRVNHFKYFRLLGGEGAIKEPKRVALSFLFENYDLEFILNSNNSITKQFKENEIKLLYKMWQNGLNSPLTSSLGRIFDAIASFADIIHTQNYEGETGLAIESYYCDDIKEFYSYTINDGIIDISSCINEILEDNNMNKICSKFINMLVEIIVEISNNYKEKAVVLTGGVFQNKTLLSLVIRRFEKLNRKYHISSTIPFNDEGISVGQIYSYI